MASLSYQEAVTAWVARREQVDPSEVTSVFVTDMDEGGMCGNDTCWFSAKVSVRFDLNGEPEQREYYVSPGEFVSEVAAVARGE